MSMRSFLEKSADMILWYGSTPDAQNPITKVSVMHRTDNTIL